LNSADPLTVTLILAGFLLLGMGAAVWAIHRSDQPKAPAKVRLKIARRNGNDAA
jgi:F0F1-type ATP synthase assembly protein I